MTYPKLYEEVEAGQIILIDDGLVAIRVEQIKGQEIVCAVENGGTLSANKSINIPGVHISLPALTERTLPTSASAWRTISTLSRRPSSGGPPMWRPFGTCCTSAEATR